MMGEARGVNKGLSIFFTAVILFTAVSFAAGVDEIIVSGVMYDQNDAASRAIVNGSIVKTGDKIGDAEIVDIRPEGIVVKKDGQQQQIGINSKPLPAPAQNAKAGNNFWEEVKEKIRQLIKGRHRPPAPVEGPKYYLKAKSFYEEARASRELRERADLYQEAIKQAQYSLEIELPGSDKSEELRGLIEDSRAEVARSSEKLKRKEEMGRLFSEGRRYDDIADNMSSYEPWTRSKKRENYNLALQYYHQAYELADDHNDKQRIDRKISRTRAYIQEIQ